MTDMTNKERFQAFQRDWGAAFQSIPAVLQHLSNYPNILSQIDDLGELNFEHLEKSQLEWISLVSKFKHPMERQFFKSYWVPIELYQYGYFIDLSKDTLPMFDVNFVFLKPYGWYKQYVYKDLSRFLRDIDSPDFNFRMQLQEYQDETDLYLEKFY